MRLRESADVSRDAPDRQFKLHAEVFLRSAFQVQLHGPGIKFIKVALFSPPPEPSGFWSDGPTDWQPGQSEAEPTERQVRSLESERASLQIRV